MAHPEELGKGLWSIPIELPNNPLKLLNCYVIKSGGGARNLIIDTGFNRPDCAEALLSGLDELNIIPENTDVFLTHLHADHTGNAGLLQDMGFSLLMSRIDFNLLQQITGRGLAILLNAVREEGLDEDFITKQFFTNPNFALMSPPFSAGLLDDGDILQYGDYILQCVLVPGHTPGHMCLYESGKQLMFLGDHVLFDISPNVSVWPEISDPLGRYLNSLSKIKQYNVRLALPAHRGLGAVSLPQRADMLLQHHEKRLTEILTVLKEQPCQTAFEVASNLNWKIRADSWDDFPHAQKWFAFAETLAHMDHLLLIGRVKKEMAGNAYRYTVVSD